MEPSKPLLKTFSDFFDKKEKKLADEKELAAAIKKDLEILYPKIQEFYTSFSESSIKAFVNHYARLKHNFMRSADYYARAAEDTLLEFRPLAEKCIWQIQQKKLFNLQCQWRAGQVSLEGIYTSYDFLYWEHDIQHCPCLPPITSEEVDLYIRYLQSENCDVEGIHFMHGWQDYERYKEAYQKEADDIMPPWYSFYDTYMGTTALLSLPDVKSEKELHYRRTFAAQRKQEIIDKGEYKEPPPAAAPAKPFLNYLDKKLLTLFVTEFESSENQELFFNYQQVIYQPSKEDEYIKEAVENALHLILSKAKEHVPIEAHSDWRQAVILAAKNYQKQKVAEAMPSVFEEYSFKIDAGIGFPPLDKPNDYEWVKQLRDEILDARQSLGEPRDFDY